MKSCIIVTGIPYSGKSIPAGILHHLGVFMGSFNLEPDSIYNRHDYYEHPQLVNINADITGSRDVIGMINTVKKISDGSVRFSYPEYRSVVINAMAESASEVGYETIGFKDPRLSFPNLLYQLTCIVRQHYPKIKLIVCKRDTESIFRTMMQNETVINHFSRTEVRKYLWQWEGLLSDVYHDFSGEKIRVRFDDFMNFPDELLYLLSGFSGLSITDSAKIFIQKRNRFFIERNNN